MSHWKMGKISVGCSLRILRAALQNIRKDWKIETVEDPDAVLDKKGGLTAKTNYVSVGNTHKQGCQLVIRMGQGGIHGSDIGFTKNADGSWKVDFDYAPDGIRDLNGAVAGSIARLKMKALAASKKYEVVTDTKIGNETVIRMLVPSEDLERGGFGV